MKLPEPVIADLSMINKLIEASKDPNFNPKTFNPHNTEARKTSKRFVKLELEEIVSMEESEATSEESVPSHIDISEIKRLTDKKDHDMLEKLTNEYNKVKIDSLPMEMQNQLEKKQQAHLLNAKKSRGELERLKKQRSKGSNLIPEVLQDMAKHVRRKSVAYKHDFHPSLVPNSLKNISKINEEESAKNSFEESFESIRLTKNSNEGSVSVISLSKPNEIKIMKLDTLEHDKSKIRKENTLKIPITKSEFAKSSNKSQNNSSKIIPGPMVKQKSTPSALSRQKSITSDTLKTPKSINHLRRFSKGDILPGFQKALVDIDKVNAENEEKKKNSNDISKGGRVSEVPVKLDSKETDKSKSPATKMKKWQSKKTNPDWITNSSDYQLIGGSKKNAARRNTVNAGMMLSGRFNNKPIVGKSSNPFA